jgi:hypothetical protein
MNQRSWIWWIALAAAIAFDYLFWKHAPGINFFVFVALTLAAGAGSAWLNGARPGWRSAVLIPFILGAAAITFLRTEPLTVLCGAGLTLGLMTILAYSYRGGNWPFYGVFDHVAAAVRLGVAAALHPAVLPAEKKPAVAAGPAPAWRRWLPGVLRGLVLALPVVLVFAALLSSADPVFGRFLNRIFDIDRLPEYIFRLGYILIGMYVLTGVILYAVFSGREEKFGEAGGMSIKPFIGFVESAVVLGSVGLLFASFVVVQFRYFFGGTANITAEGFTYAEYARRGFGELVAVAFFSLMLLLAFGSLTRREQPAQRRVFSGLSVFLVAMAAVILASSYGRLLLYEDAYGFTSLRLYTHVFILWLGVLLAAAAALELFGRIRFFSAAAIAAAAGFTLTLAILNVDATIVRMNGLRSFEAGPGEGAALDTAYFGELSADAVPELVALYQASAGAERDDIGAGLSCRLARMEESGDPAWQSYRRPVAEALRLLRASGVAEAYPVDSDRGWFVNVGGEPRSCRGREWID